MKNTGVITALAGAFVFSLASQVMADAHPKVAIQTADSSLSTVFVDGNGMTLYTFTKDKVGVSNGYDKCATNWPPLTASEGAQATEDFSLVERKDGKMQWALNGMPLYSSRA